MALALGKPIVATRVAMSGVDLNQAAVILAETPQEFAEAVDALLKDKERRIAMGAKNRDYAVRELDWRSIRRGGVSSIGVAL